VEPNGHGPPPAHHFDGIAVFHTDNLSAEGLGRRRGGAQKQGNQSDRKPNPLNE
jgi:hypothetical protein